MNIYIQNRDEEQSIIVTGFLKGTPAPTLAFLGEESIEEKKSKRYVLRPGEDLDFILLNNELLGIEEL